MSNSVPKVIILGSDPHIFQACADRGAGGIAVRDVRGHLRGDNLLPPGFREVVVGDLTDVGEVASGLMRLCDGRLPDDVSGVITMNEFAVATARCIGHELGLRPLPITTTVRMRDKYSQKRAVAAAGVRTAATRVTIAGSKEYRIDYPGPCVVKPLAGAGASRTYKCRSEREYESALRSHMKGDNYPLVIEDLIDVGEEWSFDGVMQDGIVAFGSLGYYARPMLDLIESSELGAGDCVVIDYRFDDSEDPETCAQARAVATAALTALDYTDGVFHLEMLREKRTKEFLFGECAGRRGGSMIEEEVKVKYGFSLAGAAIDVLLGRPVSKPAHLDPRWIGTTYMYLDQGTILRVAEPEELLSLGFVHEVHISSLIGPNTRPAHVDTAYRQGMCVVSGRTRQEMLANMAHARRVFEERSIVAPTAGTKAEIREFMERMRQNRQFAAHGG